MITGPKKTHILIVTDNPNLAEHITQTFHSSEGDFRISEVSCLAMTKLFLKSHQPDVIIAELKLPDGDSSELLPGKLDEGDYPVIILSSEDDNATAQRIMNLGALEYLIKSESSIATLPYIIERVIRDWDQILDHKIAEESLISSESYLQTIFKSSSDGLFLIDQSGHYLDVNPAGCKMFGYTRKKFLDSDIQMVLFPEDCDEELELLQTRMSREDTRSEMQLRKSDGESIWVELTTTPILKLDETFILLIKRDITYRKVSENTLIESEERFRQLIEHAGDEIFVFDQDWNIILVNQRACDNLGYSREELLNLTLPDINPEFLTIDKGQDFFVKISLKIPVIIESNHIRKDLSLYPVELNLIQMNLGGNEVYRANVRDITERKQLIKAVIKSESQFRSLITNLPAKVIRYNIEKGDFIHLNSPDEKLADPRGLIIREYVKVNGSPIHHEDLSKFPELFNYWDKSGTNEPLRLEYRIILDDGSYRWEECFLFKELSSKDNPVAVMQVSWDITEKKNAEITLYRSELRYRHLFKNIPVMIAGVEVNPEEYTYWNKDVNWSGYTFDEWKKLTETEKLAIIHPDDVKELTRQHEAWKDSDDYDTLAMEYRVLTKEGNYRWIQCLFYKEADKSGELYARIQLSSDITERKLVEIALKQSEQKYRDIFAHLPMRVFQFEEQQKKHTYWDTNKNWCGKTLDEWNALSTSEQDSYIHPEDLKIFKPLYDDWLNNDKQAHLEAQYRVKSETGDYVFIKSRFFKESTTPNEPPTTIQLSWKVTDREKN